MKKTLSIAIATLFAIFSLAACSGIQVQDEAAQNVIVKLAGHRLGYEMGKKDPATAAIAAKAADGIIQTIETGTTAPALSALLQEGLAKLAAGYKDDPALAAEVAIVAELVIFQGSQVDTEAYNQYIGQMKAGLEGYKLGYALALAAAVK